MLHLLLLDLFASFCSIGFRCGVKVPVWDLSKFYMKLLSAVNFPLSPAFTVSHKPVCIMTSFLFNSRKSSVYLYISSLIHWQLNIVLFSSHDFVGFFCYCWNPALILGDLIECRALFQFSCVFWNMLCDQLFGQFWRAFHEVLRKKSIYIFFCVCVWVNCSIDIC